MPVKPMMLVPDVPSEKNALRYRKTPSTSSSNDGSFDCHQPFKMLPPAISLMTPTCSASSSLSRARSVPLPATEEEEAAEPPSRSSLSPLTASASEAVAKATGQSTTHYTVVATDCRRSALLMSNSGAHLNSRRGSSIAPASSFGSSFGGNDADHEDNIDEEDDVKQTITTVEEEDEEDTAECERRSKRQREALIRLETEDSSLGGCDSDYDPSKHHRPKRQHLSVNNLGLSKAKCAKTLESSQQRNRQLQFLRQVHSSHKRINDLKATQQGEKVSKEAEVEDEFSGLGRQIRKLSSRAALDFDTTTTMNNSRCKTETTKQVVTNSLTTTGNIHYGTSNALFRSTARQQKPDQPIRTLQAPPSSATKTRKESTIGETLANFASTLMGSKPPKNNSKTKEEPKEGHDMALPGKKSIMPGDSANRKMFRRQDTPRTLDSPPQLRLRALKKASTSSGDHKFMMPPSISIECAADDHHQPEEDYLKTSRLRPSSSPQRTPSSDSTQRGFSSLDTDKDVDTPILDEFAQYLNASIHPPNELSVPRCYETITGPVSPTRLTASCSTAPSSRRPSTSSRGAFLATPNHRYSRSLSLGYSGRETTVSNSRNCVSRGNSRTSSQSSGGSRTPNSPSRPQLRRESAQDLGDDPFDHSSKFKFCSTPSSGKLQTPPDLKIELLSENSSSNGKQASYSSLKSRGSSVMLLGAPGNTSGLRRHSNNLLTTASPRNKSAPVTPLNRSTSNVNAASNIPYQAVEIRRSNSRDTYLDVPSRNGRERGASLPNQNQETKTGPDLYRLREFTVMNKKIIGYRDSLQPRYNRSNTSIHSSASSLTFSHSGRSSLRSSTDEDERDWSRNSSFTGARYTVLVMGATEVGKTTLTSQFVSSSDVGTSYNTNQSLEEEYGEKCVNVMLDGEESELVFIDHASSEISMENALATYMPDAMVIVYSVVDSSSLNSAEEMLQYVWKTNGSGSDKAVILVGNKSDLVRTRTVSIVDAKAVASAYDCKYTETSGALNHNVDELLVGILKQIRLKSAEKSRCQPPGGKKHLMRLGLSVPTSKNPVARRKSAGARVRGLLGKMIRGDSKSKSCDDMHVL